MQKIIGFPRFLSRFMALLLVALAAGCGGGGQDPILGVGASVATVAGGVCIPNLSPAKAITAYSLNGSAGVINEPAKTISVTMPSGTVVTALVATFAITGTGATVNGVAQVSGTTANNFTAPVTYTVTAGDCTTVAYTVTVTVSVLPLASCAGPGPLDLASSASYAVLAGTALTLANPQVITGDVGSPSITPAAGPSSLVGTMRDAGTDPAPGAIQTAVTDMQAAFTCATVTRACDPGPAFNFPAATDFAALPQPLAAGHYCVTGAMSVGSPLTLTNPGVYIFQSTGALDTAVGPFAVTLAGAANAANTSVYWVPGGIATIQANVAFLGNILANNAAVTLGANSTLIPGRALSGAAVNLLSTNTVTKPTP